MSSPAFEPAPATMTLAGRRFLQELAAEARSGVYLEVGPLFGSSTQVIDAGRKMDAPVHTIDTFEAADWVVRRLGIELSREAFDRYTGHIKDLVVHQGFAPDVVKETWSEPIGFFFDDATHGDPGWSANFDFFSPFFTEDAIVCGDDFAGGWPDIPRNVTRIAEEWGVGLYVFGRVWAITKVDESRIVAAAERAEPELAGASVEVVRNGETVRGPAMCWSKGLHQLTPMTSMRFDGDAVAKVRLVAQTRSGERVEVREGQTLDLADVVLFRYRGPENIGVQFCCAQGTKTENTRLIRDGGRWEVPAGAQLVSVRFGMV